jgi:hypothetical protein
MTTIDRNTMLEVSIAPEEHINIMTTPILNISFDQSLQIAMKTNICPVQTAGFLVQLPPDSQGITHRIRIENVNYSDAREIRGNQKNIELQIIELIQTSRFEMNTFSKYAKFLQYFPIYQSTASQIYYNIYSLAQFLAETYNKRYRQGQYVETHPNIHNFLKIAQIEIPRKQRRSQQTNMDICFQDFLLEQPADVILNLLNAN